MSDHRSNWCVSADLESTNCTDITLNGVVSWDTSLGWQPQDILPLSNLSSSVSVIQGHNYTVVTDSG